MVPQRRSSTQAGGMQVILRTVHCLEPTPPPSNPPRSLNSRTHSRSAAPVPSTSGGEDWTAHPLETVERLPLLAEGVITGHAAGRAAVQDEVSAAGKLAANRHPVPSQP